MSKYTEEELELLSDEEREALEEDDFDEDEGDTTGDEEEDQSDDAQDEGEDGEGDADADPDPAQQDTTPDQGDTPDQGNDAEPAPPSAPVAEIAAAQEKITALKANKAKLLSDYNDGEIDEDELNTKLDEIMDGIATASTELGTLQTQQQAAQQAWFDSVNAHLNAYPEIKENQAWFDAMDAQVTALSTQPAFTNKPYAALLKAAHSAVAASADALGVSGFPALRVDPGNAPPPPKSAKPAPHADKRNAGLGKTPETLRDVPAAAATDPDESEAAELEKLNPDEYEAVWANMPQEKKDRLLRYM